MSKKGNVKNHMHFGEIFVEIFNVKLTYTTWLAVIVYILCWRKHYFRGATLRVTKLKKGLPYLNIFLTVKETDFKA